MSVLFICDHSSTKIAELDAAQGKPVDLGGYYFPAAHLVELAMRPSEVLNGILAGV